MAKEFELKIEKIKTIKTKNREMKTSTFPVAASVPLLKKLRKYEPRSMSGQPLALWDHAKGFNVYDKYGNKWLDWSSGVLVANAGHSNPAIVNAIVKQARHGLLHNYCFPSEMRMKLTEKLSKLAPYPLKKVFLLTTGSETNEVAFKLVRTFGQKKYGPKKIAMISFSGAFHGRTLASQMLGGSPALKDWIVNQDKDIAQAPFPNCFRCPWGKKDYEGCDDFCFKNFTSYLKKNLKMDPKSKIAGIILETYQGGGSTFAPKGFMKQLRSFCTKNKILLVMDEVQAGFGRCGTFWGFEYYGIVPDIAVFGKGISSSLPISAVLGRADVMDLYEPNTMTSTHTGNPVCVAAALANIDFIIKKKLVANCAKIGAILKAELAKVKANNPDIIGALHGAGLVYALHIVKPYTKDPDGDMAHEIVKKSVQKGLMMFAPVGFGSASVKIAPPLVITAEAALEGVTVLKEAIREAKQEMAR
ncbi:MAG: aminotransferase class III-fold pyridoxal phosphate-dependent enzyme [Candidatus Firestonebacteria bacterium]